MEHFWYIGAAAVALLNGKTAGNSFYYARYGHYRAIIFWFMALSLKQYASFKLKLVAKNFIVILIAQSKHTKLC